MDALALLCNLHAGGPLALRRLREAGLASLAELARLPDERLAGLLDETPTRARRIREEARQLALRLGQGEEQANVGSERSPGPGRRAPRDEAPQEPPVPSDTPLRPGSIEGLSERTCERLVEQGVLTLEALVEHASLGLARRIGVPFPRLIDLEARARRAIAEGRRVPAAVRRDTQVIAPRESEPVRVVRAPRRAPIAAFDLEPSAERSGGPFA